MARGGLRFSLSLILTSYDVINDVIMSNADYTPGREPRSVAAMNCWSVSHWVRVNCWSGVSHW